MLTRGASRTRFTHIFDQDARQDDVFDRVADEAVRSTLDGYNSTIFAYGQTGSGACLASRGRLCALD